LASPGNATTWIASSAVAASLLSGEPLKIPLSPLSTSMWRMCAAPYEAVSGTVAMILRRSAGPLGRGAPSLATKAITATPGVGTFKVGGTMEVTSGPASTAVIVSRSGS